MDDAPTAAAAPTVFDSPGYVIANEARWDCARPVLQRLRDAGLATAIDVGCGVGDLTVRLADMGFSATGIDGRRGNVDEARRRHPGIPFLAADVDEMSVHSRDLVFCFGLLYHMEDPFRSIRRLAASTGRILLLETIVLDDPRCDMRMVDECGLDDQGLRQVAFHMSEDCLLRMLRHAGLPQMAVVGRVLHAAGTCRAIVAAGRERVIDDQRA